MTCVHLQQLVQLCHDSELRLSSSDLIHIVCKQCGKQDVCPSNLVEQFDAEDSNQAAAEVGKTGKIAVEAESIGNP
ncbi:hypothetical protein [Anatilimnocola floriformis]|uniref:hypothetical protein n=1 Tax=Anatilimnocola floriformis TaxID=2948575 RepID=UPI0020C454BA|nr:hypothetical protein [Anatilimnocola floriformis]